MNAPETLEEARTSPLLEKVRARRDADYQRLVAEYGEPKALRGWGSGPEFRKVLEATDAGRDYLARSKAAVRIIQDWAQVAEAYGYEAWSRINTRSVHRTFLAQPDRLELLQRPWATEVARAEVKRRTAAVKVKTRDPYTATPATPRVPNGNASPTTFVPRLVGKPAEWSPAAVQVLKDEWIDRSKALDALGLFDEMVAVFDDLQQFEDDESATA